MKKHFDFVVLVMYDGNYDDDDDDDDDDVVVGVVDMCDDLVGIVVDLVVRNYNVRYSAYSINTTKKKKITAFD
jgi:hypothetical protein